MSTVDSVEEYTESFGEFVPEQEGIDESISIPETISENEYTVETLEIATPEEIDIATWGFIGFGSAGALILLSLGIATILRLIRGSM